MTKSILIPLPSYGFDPTEASIPWKILTSEGYKVVFATPNNLPAKGDDLMLNGKNLGIWKSILKTRKDAVEAYQKMVASAEFQNPISYQDINAKDFDGLVIPGGHDKGMIEFLESKKLQQEVACFFNMNKPVGAICHGMVLVARSVDNNTKKSVIYNYKVTALLKKQELAAYNMTKLWLKDYYLTYPGFTVEDEVKSVLSSKNNFKKGPKPILRDSIKKLSRGFCVKDKNLVSARWPGDAYNFSLAFIDLLKTYKIDD